jgi:hypothetical protein
MPRLRSFFAVLGSCVLTVISAPAAHTNDLHILEAWVPITTSGKLSERVRLATEIQPRFSDQLNRYERLFLRASLGYQLTKSLSVWNGYAYMQIDLRLNPASGEFNASDQTENRIQQQLLHECQWKRLRIVNRARLEERWIEAAGNTSVRARYMLRLAYPLNRSETWSIVGYNEAFWNLNHTARGPAQGFDQNRLFMGINRKLSPSVSLEAGYMHNPLNIRGQSGERMNHVLVVGFNIKH